MEKLSNHDEVFANETYQDYFDEVMENRPAQLRNVYAAGIKGLDNWYGDKSYREFYTWADVIDEIISELDNVRSEQEDNER